MAGREISIESQGASSLTKDAAFASIRDFFREIPLIIFGSGMSCALDVRFGMGALRNELCSRISPESLPPLQKGQWESVQEALNSGSDLEASLGYASDGGLLEMITSITGEFISSIDQENAFKISEGTATWPATGLFEHLVNNVSEGDPSLHVVTPNYDTLFEHACDAAGICYTDGFMGVMERRMDWSGAFRSLVSPQTGIYSSRTKRVGKLRKHARLYKVHGSLSFFFHKNSLIENTSWMWDPPQFAHRVMITPGFTKYESLQHHRQELLGSADKAVERSSRFLFLGYGFNDSHLERYINEKLTTQSCQGLIVTRDSNPRIQSLLNESENLWLVCKVQDVPRQLR